VTVHSTVECHDHAQVPARFREGVSAADVGVLPAVRPPARPTMAIGPERTQAGVILRV